MIIKKKETDKSDGKKYELSENSLFKRQKRKFHRILNYFLIRRKRRDHLKRNKECKKSKISIN